jgi:hypothetical protein
MSTENVVTLIFWVGMMAMKKHFFQFGLLNIKDGPEIRF